MKERPILFSLPMVRAILEGRKTQTRRVVKPQPESFVTKLFVNEHGCGISADEAQNHIWRCTYGAPGDRLWVRECWRFGYPVHADGPSMNIKTLQYRADYGSEADVVPWKPSIHMKRKDSRITLEVLKVRIERLQQITEADCIAEGILPFESCLETPEPIAAFAHSWDAQHGAGSWNANPWVWVVEFKPVAA